MSLLAFPTAPSAPQSAPVAGRFWPAKTLLGILAVSLGTSLSPAADLRLTGNYTHSLSNVRQVNPNNSLSVSGRRNIITAPYVRLGSFLGGGLTNFGPGASSYLSVEFHRKNFVGALGGEYLYSRASYGLAAGASYPQLGGSGYFKSPNRTGFGAVVIYELGVDSTTGLVIWTRRSTKYTNNAKLTLF